MGSFDFLKKKTVPVEDINEALKNKPEGVLILDVRDTPLYGKGHIEGSFSLPVFIVGQWSNYLPEDKETPIYVVGKDDEEATRAAGYLTDRKFLAFTNVKNLGGIGAYKGELQAGLKVKEPEV
ncbi:MAG: rhodanese-like domain-containing protein [Lachnospiraceae bacterium]|nr:rhodanese-like domain-containing protein [Lachnospiraceae bacterium]